MGWSVSAISRCGHHLIDERRLSRDFEAARPNSCNFSCRQHLSGYNIRGNRISNNGLLVAATWNTLNCALCSTFTCCKSRLVRAWLMPDCISIDRVDMKWCPLVAERTERVSIRQPSTCSCLDTNRRIHTRIISSNDVV
ncbi:hypothetical protein SeLEV6574_g05007 [Synchytrium endobioticum]|uniref:Uncharacterized protein n=1 Tax=Synchytrium endobioticum TaxID=286115 RepID=A0A507CXD8_9FUNG|nr:hypothetical protein SeLEV6574_g05007 [Synchytrium endobioticum]